MSRLTEYDEVRKIYRLKVDCNMGENIQKLGRLEDKTDMIKDIINHDAELEGEGEKIAKYNTIKLLFVDAD